MKSLNRIMILFLSMLCSYSINTFAYIYTFVNETGKKVKVQLYAGPAALIALNERAVQIKPSSKHEFKFVVGKSKGKAGLCLGKIMISVKGREWGQWKEAKIKFMRNKEEVPRARVFAYHQGGVKSLSMCRDKKLFLRINPETNKVSAVIKIGKSVI